MKISTGSLDRAAFLMTFGGKLTEIQGKYPDNTFIVDAPVWLQTYERLGGWVPYNYFCNMRHEVKRRSRRQAGLPEHFTGDRNHGFKLGDIAVVRPWRKGEK